MATLLVLRHVLVVVVFAICWVSVEPARLFRFRRAMECGKNETLSTCGPCDTRCPAKESKVIRRQCPTQCAAQEPACRCKDGYYRFNNLCLLATDCPNDCPKNEKAASCAYAISCQATCSKPQVTNTTETEGTFNICSWQVCDKSTCVCNDGFIRDDKTLQCIPLDSCPKGTLSAKKPRSNN